MVPFKYKMVELTKSTLIRYLCCLRILKKRFEVSRKYKLFNNGIKKLQKKFEITNIIKAMQDSELVSAVILAKYQKNLIRYFKRNVLQPSSNSSYVDTTAEPTNQKKMVIYLQ